METREEEAPPVPRVTSSPSSSPAVVSEVEIPSFEKVLEAGKELVLSTVPEMEAAQIVGSFDVAVGDGGGRDKAAAMVEEKIVAKKKRGRPRGPAKTEAKTVTKTVEDEEDVCFICFDGGDLVLCDRKGCPKAYHPTCIKRDEAFFRSKAKWNCGWHICSNCEKTSHYMCYTCTYSLCKGCIKHADIFCARGNKGFCTACMRTIMLIENNGQGNKDVVQVDFDDKTSWEYLFKVYWVYLKTKLSLTLDELTKAKLPGQEAVLVAPKTKSESSDDLYDGNDGKGYSSDSFSGYQEGKTHSRKKRKKQPKLPVKEKSPSMTITYNEKALPLHSGLEWASKELLDFVAHMKNGDTSILSEFDVQALLLEYIKTNNLRDPHRKSQIICDSRLRNLFGKARVGHFEMLKLLELHFQKNEETQSNSTMPGGFMGHIATPFEVENANDNQMLTHKDKRHKRRKVIVNRRQQTNLDEYAAINFHNINLIYLRRSLIESLIEDTEKFEGHVVGSVVRIRISSSDQKQDYRLVRVGGTSKVSTPYKVGEKTVDIMLEILNLNKKEVISIDEISNQEFSKDECTRLRQSIKFGLVRRFTVGEILEKAVALQAVRVNDWLEEEKLRLTHLRDRASENGHRKELRECVEKLELLNSPEERQRRQREIPEVHADPRMDPRYDSDDGEESDYYKQECYNADDKVGPVNFSSRERKPSFQQRSGKTPKDKNISASKKSATYSTTAYPGKGLTRTDEEDTGVSCGNTILPFATETADNSEIEKMWHYRDPMGTIQGPFAMFQLRKWSTSGYFPYDLRVWSINGKQDDSLLLTDAMKGINSKETQLTMHTTYDATAHSNANAELIKSLFSLPSPTFSGKSSEPEKLQGTWPDQNHVHENPDTTVIQSNEECSNNQSNSGQSTKQVDCSLSASNNNSNFIFETKSIETPEQTHVVYFPDLPSPTPKPSSDNKQPVSSNASILVGIDTQLPKIAGEWGGHSPTPEKITVEELCADLNFSPILDDGQPSNSSPSHPVSVISGWQAMLDAEESKSFSDLLAEVEAMDSLNGPPSPTSKDDCFSSVEGLSPTLEGQPFNFTNEILMSSFPCHSAGSNRPNVALEEKRFLDGHYSVTDETEGGTKFKATTQWEGISETHHPPESSSASWDMPENNTDSGWGSVNRNANVDINWGGPVQININMGWGNGQGNHPPQANANINWGNSPGSNNMGGVWPNQQKYNGSSERTPSSHSQRGSGYGRDRQSWNRQSSFGSGDGSGGSFRPSPKGQRICKFYESGHCKKGAFCNYLHP